MTQPEVSLENWKHRFNHYWGAMFECGDFEQLMEEIEQLLSEKEKEVKEKTIKFLEGLDMDIAAEFIKKDLT